ncbi:hypothetical protein Tco_0446572 [Tanacetum coccineum]
MSTAEAEYVSLSTCCAQVIWMRTQLLNYAFRTIRFPCIVIQKAQLLYLAIRTEYQLAGLFTKAFHKERFEYLVHRIVGYQGAIDRNFDSIPQRLEEDYHSIKDDIPLVYKDYVDIGGTEEFEERDLNIGGDC